MQADRIRTLATSIEHPTLLYLLKATNANWWMIEVMGHFPGQRSKRNKSSPGHPLAPETDCLLQKPRRACNFPHPQSAETSFMQFAEHWTKSKISFTWVTEGLVYGSWSDISCSFSIQDICDISTIFPPVIGCIKCPTDFPVLDRRHVSHFSHLTDCITFPTEFPVLDSHFSHLTGCITFPTEFPVLDKWHVSHFSRYTGSITCPAEFPVLNKWHVSHFSYLTGCITFPTEFKVPHKWHVGHFSHWIGSI